MRGGASVLHEGYARWQLGCDAALRFALALSLELSRSDLFGIVQFMHGSAVMGLQASMRKAVTNLQLACELRGRVGCKYQRLCSGQRQSLKGSSDISDSQANEPAPQKW